MKALFVKHLGALRPADDDADTILSKLKDGDLVKAEIKVPRNLAHHRKFWKLMSIVYENQTYYQSPEHVCTAFKVATGHCDYLQTQRGLVGIPRSISFAKMDQPGFEKFYSDAVDYLCREVIPSLDKETLKREVEELLR